MTTTTETAAEAYTRHHTEATALATRIADALVNDAWPSALNWGHVGDITEAERQLREIADRMFGEGEHAPENQ